MADETQAPPVEEAPPAPAPASAPEDQVIVLTDYALVLGEMRPHGKVLRLPAEEAQRLIGEGVARAATEFDLKIAGLAE